MSLLRKRAFARVPAFVFSLLAAAAAAPAETAPATGSVEGTVTIKERPALRVADRYAGAAGSGTHELPPVPVMVYLKGATGGRPGNDVQLAQRDTAFVPRALIVAPGTTVRFPNQDPFFHNVFSFSKTKRFDLGRYPRGEAKAVTFDEPGLVKVYCEVHKWMRAAVLVTESPHRAILPENGRFQLQGVPSGEYHLVIWHFDRGEKTVPVRVGDGATKIDVTI